MRMRGPVLFPDALAVFAAPAERGTPRLRNLFDAARVAVTMARTLAAAGVIAFALATAVNAPAKGYPLVFDQVTAEPGDVVNALVPGTPRNYVAGGNPLGEERVRVYLVAVTDAHRVRRFMPRDPRLVEVGILEGSLGYHGKATFEVPQVRPGAYTTAVFVNGGFYVTQPQFRAEYGVRGPLVLRVRRRDDGILRATAAAIAAAAALALHIRVRRRQRVFARRAARGPTEVAPLERGIERIGGAL